MQWISLTCEFSGCCLGSLPCLNRHLHLFLAQACFVVNAFIATWDKVALNSVDFWLATTQAVHRVLKLFLS
jgi:hypothetical protein